MLFIADVKAQQPPDTILPPEIVTDFKGRFNNMEPAEWTVTGDNYLITFLKDNKWYEVSYTKKGKMTGLNILINFDALPEVIKQKLSLPPYADYEILKILEIQTADQKKNYHIIMLNQKEEEVVVQYSETGELIK
jgi:hypothetical protein